MVDQPRVRAGGELDAATTPELERRVLDAIETNPGATVVVDLADVEFLDSSALGMLVKALKRARAAGGDLALTRPQPRVWKVFEVTRLDEVFAVVD